MIRWRVKEVSKEEDVVSTHVKEEVAVEREDSELFPCRNRHVDAVNCWTGQRLGSPVERCSSCAAKEIVERKSIRLEGKNRGTNNPLKFVSL